MVIENLDHDTSKARKALETAKRVNTKKVVPLRVNSQTVVFVTEEQAKDSKFVEETIKKLNEYSPF